MGVAATFAALHTQPSSLGQIEVAPRIPERC